jgi:hypothetical protein
MTTTQGHAARLWFVSAHANGIRCKDSCEYYEQAWIGGVLGTKEDGVWCRKFRRFVSFGKPVFPVDQCLRELGADEIDRQRTRAAYRLIANSIAAAPSWAFLVMTLDRERTEQRQAEQASREWFTAEKAQVVFGVGQRAIRKRVEAGRLERKREGRRSFYREVTP